MADTVRPRADILALLADNTTGDISEQDHRDSIVSMFGVYGGIRVADGSTAQSGITTTPELFTGFAANGLSSDMTADHTADSITVGTDGIYFVYFQVSYSGTGNAVVEFHLRVDAVEQAVGTHRKVAAGGDTASASFGDFLSLSAAEVVTVYVQTDQGGGAAITAIDATLLALKIA